MKPLYFPAILIIFISTGLFSAHCTKEHGVLSQTPCDTCGQSTASPIQETTLIEDSVWERQGTGIFKSDITSQLRDAGITVDQVYALYIVRDGIAYQIFPYRQANYMSGVIFASIYSSGDSQACTIMYSDTNQELHYGESPRGGYLPFRSITIEVLSMK